MWACCPMWLVSLEVRPSIYLYEVGNEIPTMEKHPEANLAAQMKEFMVQPISSNPFLCIPREVPSLMESYSSFVVPHNFLLCVSLALNFFQPLFSLLQPLFIDFSQSTIVAKQSCPRYVTDFWTCVSYYLLLGSRFSVFWNWWAGPLYHARTMGWAPISCSYNGLGPYIMPVQ